VAEPKNPSLPKLRDWPIFRPPAGTRQHKSTVLDGRAPPHISQVVPLKGNRFYATYDASTQEYWVCVALKGRETGSTYGLPEGLLSGGTYASARLQGGFAEIVRNIAPTFERLREQHKRDPRRPPIEYYKRQTEVILYLPIDDASAFG
jgi:hypothetical protein